ncbi:MAG: hypothetical protein WC804_21250, partial [Sphingomonas sp.]|uniref:hypothetical protein n=1 Tax=Sphingomonas sp. TaxID=28214 RepID=UPI0035624C3E
MKRVVHGLAAMLLSVLAMPSLAAPTPLSTRWMVDTSQVPGHLDLHKGAVLLSANLLPSKLVTLNAIAVVEGTGEVQAEPGAQFLRYVDGTGQDVYCSTKTIDLIKKTGIIMIRYGDTYLCLLDRDHDGKFDHGYRVRSGLETELPIMALGKTDGWLPIAPASYSEIEPAKINVPLALILRWEYGNGVADRIGFSVEIHDLSRNSNRDRLRLATWFGLNAGQVPGAFDFANIRIRIASTEQKA